MGRGRRGTCCRRRCTGAVWSDSWAVLSRRRRVAVSCTPARGRSVCTAHEVCHCDGRTTSWKGRGTGRFASTALGGHVVPKGKVRAATCGAVVLKVWVIAKATGPGPSVDGVEEEGGARSELRGRCVLVLVRVRVLGKSKATWETCGLQGGRL
jgi:hypothetical protein